MRKYEHINEREKEKNMEIDFEHAMLNEKYMKYYRKDDIPLVFPYHCRCASDLVKIEIPEPEFVLENADDMFYPCINDPNSLTNVIRRLEHKEYYLSEEDMQPDSSAVIVDIWKDLCKRFFDKQLLNLSYSDMGIINDGYCGNIVNHMKTLTKSKKNDVSLAIQVGVPFFNKDSGMKKIKDFMSTVIDSFNRHGYNYSGLNVVKARRQPLIERIDILFMTFEAIYNEVIDELSENLYHITSYDLLKSIHINGIVPQAYTSMNRQHPKRAYLFSNAPVNSMLEFMSERFKLDEKPCLLKISKRRLVELDEFKNGKMKFYVDPMFTQKYGTIAIFTTEAVPASLIDNDVVCFKFDLYKNALKDKIIKMSEV